VVWGGGFWVWVPGDPKKRGTPGYKGGGARGGWGGGGIGRYEGKATFNGVFCTTVSQLPDDDHEMGRNVP